ncbi:hydrolase [Priestia megaterium]|uniref:hydrolase n=1 Tax=Priestia megaterium TaxID=1404 RepID=UPI000BF83019|nr:hydrolase [Priestia megaterium]PEU72176.1 hydrolase [Priestia megaterium]PGR01383.1 hydrolase [Priestia megaterium]
MIKILLSAVLFFSFMNCSASAAVIKNVDFGLQADEVVITFLPLSAGEASLIQDGSGETILINTGNASSYLELKKWLKRYKVKKINQLVITKQQKYYDSNVQRAVNDYHIKRIIVPAQYQAEFQTEKWKENDLFQLTDNIHVDVLHASKQKTSAMDLLFTIGEHRILYAMSSSDEVEEKFLRIPLTHVDVLKIPNFGEGTFFSNAFLKQLDTQLAVMFTKPGCSYSPRLLSNLTAEWIELYDVREGSAYSIKMSLKSYDVMKFSAK